MEDARLNGSRSRGSRAIGSRSLIVAGAIALLPLQSAPTKVTARSPKPPGPRISTSSEARIAPRVMNNQMRAATVPRIATVADIVTVNAAQATPSFGTSRP